MADNIPNIPTGAVPPKKETGKVQPKKETVRINLPPKPTAAPTIKLPTLPPGGPTGAGGIAPMQAAAPAPAPAAAPHAAPAPAAAPAPRAAAAPMAQAPRAGAPVQRPVAVPAARTVNPVDNALAIAAGVVGLIAVGSTVYLAFLL